MLVTRMILGNLFLNVSLRMVLAILLPIRSIHTNIVRFIYPLKATGIPMFYLIVATNELLQ